MAMARPVVCTSVAADGISAFHGEHLITADTPESFAAAVAGLLVDRALAHRIGLAARCFIEEHHDWTVNMNRLEALLAG